MKRAIGVVLLVIAANAAAQPCTLNVNIVPSAESPHPVGAITLSLQDHFTGPHTQTHYDWQVALPTIGYAYRPVPQAQVWTWTPPAAGDYIITGKVTIVSQTPLVTVTVCGTATMPYHITTAKDLGVTLSATPDKQSPPGDITLHAVVSGRQGIAKFVYAFSYAPFFGQGTATPSGRGTVTSESSRADWVLRPVPVPNLYVMRVLVEGYSPQGLAAEGSALYPSQDGYVVVAPLRGGCPPPAGIKDAKLPFGWLRAITTQNTNQPVSTPTASGNCAVAGYSIRDIVLNPQIRVRANNISCHNCHQNMAWQKESFCSMVGSFHHGDTDPMLKNLLLDWKGRGCPD